MSIAGEKRTLDDNESDQEEEEEEQRLVGDPFAFRAAKLAVCDINIDQTNTTNLPADLFDKMTKAQNERECLRAAFVHNKRILNCRLVEGDDSEKTTNAVMRVHKCLKEIAQLDAVFLCLSIIGGNEEITHQNEKLHAALLTICEEFITKQMTSFRAELQREEKM